MALNVLGFDGGIRAAAKLSEGGKRPNAHSHFPNGASTATSRSLTPEQGLVAAAAMAILERKG